MLRSVSSGHSDGERELRDQAVPGVANVPRGLAIFQPGAASATIDCPTDGEAILCECLQVPFETVRACIARGLTTQEELAAETGVTTVCGGCTPRVAALLGVGSGFRVRLVEVRGISPGVRSFRFEPLDPTRELRPALPGQHIVVSGTIRGHLVSRPYTITSPADEQEFHEISVKREPDGLFSMWLFSQSASSHDAIYITDPRGDFHVDMSERNPVIFLVAGIGVTPAMALARSLASAPAPRGVLIDYSARNPDSFAFREELERLARGSRRLRVLFRDTESGQRLGLSDVRRYHQRLPDGRFRICGPDGYREDVQRYLAEAGVEARRVRIEQFTPVQRVVVKPEVAPRRWSDTLVRVLGLVLLAAYVAQGTLGLTWEWLETLQEQESYRRWSGFALLAFIALQWTLPALRLGGSLRATARVYPWHRWMGAMSPALFYAHATGLGYGYLVALGSVYLANVLVGLGDKTLIGDPALRDRYGRAWLVPHVCLAFLTLGLAIFHVVVVLGYR